MRLVTPPSDLEGPDRMPRPLSQAEGLPHAKPVIHRSTTSSQLCQIPPPPPQGGTMSQSNHTRKRYYRGPDQGSDLPKKESHGRWLRPWLQDL